MSWVDRASTIHVFCACGAAWHGRYAIANEAIIVHRRTHGLLAHEAYRELFHCACADCIEARREARRRKREPAGRL